MIQVPPTPRLKMVSIAPGAVLPITYIWYVLIANALDPSCTWSTLGCAFSKYILIRKLTPGWHHEVSKV